MKILGRFLGIALLPFLMLFSVGAKAADRPYDFDWNSKNDLRGAWFMCSLKGFPGKECRDVFKKCNLPPMLDVKCNKKGCKKVSTCLKPPSFYQSQEDTNKAIDYAQAHPELGGDPGALPDPEPDPEPGPGPEPQQ